nr:hypothetical protein [Tanacetum cinerariifolium]
MEAHLAPTQPPHDTQCCMENPEQAFVEYASSRTDKAGGKRFTPNQGLKNFNDATNTWKEKPNLNWEQNEENSMAPKSIAAISHDEWEELKQKGVKSLTKLFSLKYLSPASIKELNKNSSAPKHDLVKITRGNEEVKEQDKEEDEIETNVKVKKVIEEEASEFETDEEVEEIPKEEGDDEDDETFNLFPTIKE